MSDFTRRNFLQDSVLAVTWAGLASPVARHAATFELPGGVSLQPQLVEMEGVRPRTAQSLAVGPASFGGARVSTDLRRTTTTDSFKTQRFSLSCIVTEGTTPTMMATWAIAFRHWTKSQYVVFPAAAYDGNRFMVRDLPYAPRLSPADATPRCPVIITDVPHLEQSAGNSAIALRTSDCSQPAVGIWSAEQGRAWIFYTEPTTAWGDSSWLLQEAEGFSSATLRLCSPGVRPWRFSHSKARSESRDTPIQMKAGDRLNLKIEVESFVCASPEGLFERLFARRGALCPAPLQRDQSTELVRAQTLIQHKHLRENWSEECSLFFSRPRPFGPTPYQSGWVGGLLSAWAFLEGTNPQCRQLAIRHFVRQQTEGMAPSGLFYGKATDGCRFIPDFALDETHPWSKRWALVRRQADALYAGLKIANALEGSPDRPPQMAACDLSLLGAAEAVSAVWKKNKSFGQFIDQFTGEIIVGNSTSAALMPAALCLSGQRYRRPVHIAIAQEAGERLYWDWTRKGVTCGGPGDALQCPDSESAFALVESFVALANATKDMRWMDRATSAACQAASWVMPYDYSFPTSSEFRRLDMRTNGVVWANAQNKHGAPGICTLPGTGLMEIDRMRGKATFGRLLQSIHFALPQFVSTVERPIRDYSGRALPEGWMNEKVNVSDYSDDVGEVRYESNWCEVSLLLSACARATRADLEGRSI